MDIENKLVVAGGGGGLVGGGGGRGLVGKFGVGRYKLLHLEWTSCEILLNSTGNYIQSLGIEC